MVRFLHIIMFLCFFNYLWSFNIGFETGLSSFNYAEVGVNNKDDLYSISSVLVGGFYKDQLSVFDYKISLRANLPYLLNVTDALGIDSTNYMETLWGVGGNLQYIISYPITFKNLSVGPGVSFNYDILFFMDNISGSSDTYIYSVLGSGPAIELLYNINKKLSLSFSTTYIFNFLPISQREGDFLWSNNFFATLGFVLI